MEWQRKTTPGCGGRENNSFIPLGGEQPQAWVFYRILGASSFPYWSCLDAHPQVFHEVSSRNKSPSPWGACFCFPSPPELFNSLCPLSFRFFLSPDCDISSHLRILESCFSGQDRHHLFFNCVLKPTVIFFCYMFCHSKEKNNDNKYDYGKFFPPRVKEEVDVQVWVYSWSKRRGEIKERERKGKEGGREGWRENSFATHKNTAWQRKLVSS